MATYTFKPVPVWGSAGRFVKMGGAAGATYPLTDPSGAAVTVNETGLTYVVADSKGFTPEFHTTDKPTVVLQITPGVSVTVHSLEAVAGSASYAAAAASSATDAATSASDAAASAASAGSKVAKGTITLYAADYPSLQAALDAAAAQPAGLVRRVVAPGSYSITTNLLIGDNTILDGQGTGVITKASTAAFKMILSKNATQTAPIPATSRITIRDISLVGDNNGSEFSAGIHLAKASDCRVENVQISNVLGDGVTVGNITGGVAAETCVRVQVLRCNISGVGRMGVALTNAEHCTVADNDIHDFTGATSLMGVGIDLEPDTTGELIRYNHVRGNRIWNTRSGVYGASAASHPVGNMLGNHVTGNIIHGVSEDGIKFSYSHATIASNTVDTAGRRGIWLVNPGQADGFVVSNNIIRDAGTATDNTYAAILLDTIVHSVVTGNLFYATATNKISKLWDEIGGCAYNTFQGNNGRQTGKAFSNVSTSNASHNLVSIAIANNTHEAFVANGKVVASTPTTGAASWNLPHGSAPTSPANGDVWTTTAGLFVRVNGATIGPLT